MKNIAISSLIVLFVTILASQALSDVHYVPYPHPTIQDAIDAAASGDTVKVQASSTPYSGDGNINLDFGGKAITVSSKDPDEQDVVANTIIDCEGSGRAFIFLL